VTGVTRSRLLETTRALVAAERGQEVLERQRELLLHDLSNRRAAAREERARVAPALAAARRILRIARIESGTPAVAAAVGAVPVSAEVELSRTTSMGVAVPRVTAAPARFRAWYGPGATTAALDEAGEAFTALLPEVASLAAAEAAVRALRRALARTVRRLNALEKVIVPALEAERRRIAAALEEEERDESLRRRSWLATRAQAQGRSP
jgi:V/A-type H+-transporting ATPase subunit D